MKVLPRQVVNADVAVDEPEELFVTLRNDVKPKLVKPDGFAEGAATAKVEPAVAFTPRPLSVPAVVTPMSALPMNSADGPTLATQTKPLLQAMLAEHPYSTLGGVDRYFKHLDALREQNPGTTAVDALSTFPVGSRQELDLYGSGHCVGMSELLVEQLTAQGVKAFAAPVELTPGLRPHGGPPYGHEAVFLPHPGGVVLLDPGLSLGEPIVIPEGGSAELTRGRTTYRFTWQEGSIRSEQVNPPSRGEYATYLLGRIENMDESNVRALAMRDRELRLAGHRADASLTAQLVIRPEAREVVLSAGGQRLTVPFAELSRLEAAITEDVAKLLATTPDALKSQLRSFVSHADDLVAVRAWLEEHPS